MLSKDISPSRLKRAVFKIQDLLHGYKGSEVSLVAFAGDAHVVVPLTDDHNTILSLLQSLYPALMPIKGVNPIDAIRVCDDLAERSPHAQILLITSTNFDKGTHGLIEAIDSSVAPITLWTFATATGAPLLTSDGRFAQDQSVSLSKLNRELVDEIARKTSVFVLPFTFDNEDVDVLLKSLARKASLPSRRELSFDTWYDIGPYLLAIAMLLFLLIFFKAREQVWFLGLIVLLPAPSIKANIADWFLRDDQRAQIALENGEYKKAAQLFPDDFRKGTAYYKAKLYDEAIKHWQGSNTADGQYNLGNAYAQKGEIDKALKSYEHALKLDPDHADAKANAELLRKIQKEQEQKQKSSENDDKNNNSQEQESEPKSSSKNDEQKDRSQHESDSKENGDSSDRSSGQKNEAPEQDEEESKEPMEESAGQEPEPNEGATSEPQPRKKNQDQEGQLDNESRYYLDQVEQHNSLYLKRKFYHESKRRKEGE